MSSSSEITSRLFYILNARSILAEHFLVTLNIMVEANDSSIKVWSSKLVEGHLVSNKGQGRSIQRERNSFNGVGL